MKAETKSFYRAAVQRAVSHIVARLDEALDLVSLAKIAALSPFHFHRVFRGMMGETPLELHRRLRMERAAFRLVNGDQSVTTIAFDAGYDTHEAFTRAFRASYGVSPSLMRQSASLDREGCARPLQFEISSRSKLHYSVDDSIRDFTTLTEGSSTMEAIIKDMPARRLAAVHHVGLYSSISEAFRRLGESVGPIGLFARPGAAMIAVYHDDPETTPVNELRSEAAVSIDEGTPLPEGLAEIRLPRGRYACMTHVGPYSGLPDAWARFMGDWLPKSGERVGEGMSHEVYVNNPMTTPANDLRTELYLPII